MPDYSRSLRSGFGQSEFFYFNAQCHIAIKCGGSAGRSVLNPYRISSSCIKFSYERGNLFGRFAFNLQPFSSSPAISTVAPSKF
jgi:hypothetical protein